MKRILKTTAMALMIMLFSNLRNAANAQFSAGITYQTFYDELSPYGRWIDYPEYGYVWCPDGGSDFRPYSTMGHWEWSDEYEWMWVSDYDWGWAPFHYGRWLYDPFYGWLWVPGYEWAPAWVVWRSGGDYCGWAPLRPGISIGINFSIGLYSPPVDWWCFAPRAYITSPRIYDYCYNPRQNVTIINNTTIINNYNYGGRGGRNVFVTGPRRNEAEGWTHQRINSVNFRDAGRPGRTEFRNNEVSMYRPNVQGDDSHRFSPRNFDRYNNRQDNNGFRRDDNANNRSNNLPQRNDRGNNGVVQNNNNNGWQNRNDRNAFDQRNNNLPNRNDERRMNPYERRDQPQQNNDRRNFGNQNNNQLPNNDSKRVNPYERREPPVQNGNNRNFDQRNFGNQNNNQLPNNDSKRVNPYERREPPVQNGNNRNFNQGNQGNQNYNQQRQQAQPRIFERKDEGNQGSRNNDNSGRGNNRRRG